MDEVSDKLKQFLERLSSEGSDVGVDSLLNVLGPESARLLRLCAIPHQFDAAVVAALDPALGPKAAKEVCDKFSALPYVSACPEGLVLQDAIRRQLFLRWLAPEHAAEFTSASERLFAHFDAQARREEAAAGGAARLKRMFHQLGFDRAAGFEDFEHLFRLNRSGFHLGKCEHLIKLVREYGPFLPVEQRWRLDYMEAKLAADRNKFDVAEGILKKLLKTDDLNEGLRVEVCNMLGLVYAGSGKWPMARECFMRARKLVTGTEAGYRLLPLINQYLGITYRETGDLEEAEELLKLSVHQAQNADNLPVLAASLNSLGTLYRKEGDPWKAQQHYEMSLRYIKELGDKLGASQVYNNLANVCLDRRDWVGSEQYLNQSLQIKRNEGDVIGEATTLNNLMIVLQRKGEVNRALTTGLDAIKIFEEAHDFRKMASVLWTLGKVCRSAGRKTEARAAYARAAQVFKKGRMFNEALDVLKDLRTL